MDQGGVGGSRHPHVNIYEFSVDVNNLRLELIKVPSWVPLLIRVWGVEPFLMILSQNHSFSHFLFLSLSLISLLFRLSNLYPGTTTRLGTFSNPRWGLFSLQHALRAYHVTGPCKKAPAWTLRKRNPQLGLLKVVQRVVVPG